jgi:chloramphenicol-sensitive protein RarD
MSAKDKRTFSLNLLFSAIVLALNWYLFIYVMNNISVNATSLAYLICPILTTVLASIFLKEQLNKGQWVAVILSILSCILLSYGHFMDMLYSFIIALSYAIYLVLQKRTKAFDKFFILTIHIVLCSLLLLPLLYNRPSDTVFGQDFYLYILLIAILFTIIPLFLNTYALKGLESSVVGILLYLNPILSFLIAIFYFDETITPMQGIAYGLIFIAVILFNIAYMERLKTAQKNAPSEIETNKK